MVSSTFGIRSKRVVTADGVRPACVLIKDGVILDIVDADGVAEDIPIQDVDNSVVMAGLVDSHVHVNEPGRTEWEGFETATRAAAAGGITTIADMPLNSDPVTTTLSAFEEKLASTSGKLFVDCAFYGGVVPGNAESLEPLIHAGVRGFKCFLIHSGIDDFPNVTEADLDSAMPILAKHQLPLLVHAELECEETSAEDWSHKPASYEAFLNSRPRRWENDAIDLMIKLCRKYKTPVHIVHLSSSDAIDAVKKAKAEGLPLTVETCPHYLTFASHEIADGDPRYKCAPPIREHGNRELLWQSALDGTIDFIVSDHSPCSPSLKFLEEGDLQKAWGGISSLQFVLPAIWTNARKRGATIEQMAKWLSSEPARFLGLAHRKGSLIKGYDADIVVWNPDAEMLVESKNIHHRHKVTPYEDMILMGRVEKTFVRGHIVFDNGEFSANAGGQLLLRERVESKK